MRIQNSIIFMLALHCLMTSTGVSLVKAGKCETSICMEYLIPVNPGMRNGCSNVEDFRSCLCPGGTSGCCNKLVTQATMYMGPNPNSMKEPCAGAKFRCPIVTEPIYVYRAVCPGDNDCSKATGWVACKPITDNDGCTAVSCSICPPLGKSKDSDSLMLRMVALIARF